MDSPPAQEPQSLDISKRTLIMLVMLSCVISLVGTVAMIYEFSTTHVAPTIIENNGAADAHAGFEIGAVPAPQQPSSTGASGFATFKVGE